LVLLAELELLLPPLPAWGCVLELLLEPPEALELLEELVWPAWPLLLEPELAPAVDPALPPPSPLEHAPPNKASATTIVPRREPDLIASAPCGGVCLSKKRSKGEMARARQADQSKATKD
jgi:hypothetical protein